MTRQGLIFIFISFFLLTCEEEPPTPNPCDSRIDGNIPELALEEVSQEMTEIKIKGQIVSAGGQSDNGLTYGMCYATSATPDLDDDCIEFGNTSSAINVSESIDAIPSGNYKFRLYGSHCAGTVLVKRLSSNI